MPADWRTVPEPEPTPGPTSSIDLTRLLDTAEDALYRRGDLGSARRDFTQAANLSLTAGRAEDLGRAALGLGGLWVHESRTAVESHRVTALRRRAMEALEPHSSLWTRLRMRATAEHDYVQGTVTATLAELDAIRTLGDPTALAEALNLAHHCLLAPHHSTVRLELADELLGVAALSNRRVDVLLGLTWRTVDLFLSGDWHAERSLRELLQALNTTPFLAIDYVAQAIEVMLAIRSGNLDTARHAADDCRDAGVRAGDADADGWYAAQLIAIHFYQGTLAELVPMLTQLVNQPTIAAPDDSLLAALALATAEAGDKDSASGALHRLKAPGLDKVTRSSTWLATIGAAVETAAILGDTDVASQATPLLTPFAQQPMMASFAIVCWGSTHQSLGMCAKILGNNDQAAQRFAAAEQENERLGHRPAQQRSRRELSAYTSPQRRHGEVSIVKDKAGWCIHGLGRTITVSDSVGMQHLALLCSQPGREIAAAALAGSVHTTTDAGPQLDRQALTSYRERIEQLQEQLRAARTAADLTAEARIEEELNWLLDEVGHATGLGGRSRRFLDEPERARTAVQKSIRRAIDKIRPLEPDLAEHLHRQVSTGTYCLYRGD